MFLTTPKIPRPHIDLNRMVWQREQLGDVKRERHVKYSSQASWPRGGIGQCQHSVRSTTSQKRLLKGTQMTPYQAKFGEDAFFLKDDIIPFGAELEYKPANPDYIEKQHVFGDKLRSGIMFGYHLHQGVNGVVICTLQTGNKS